MALTQRYCAGAQVAAAAMVALLAAAGCEKSAPEPPSEPAPARASSASKADESLRWEAPPAWKVERTADEGRYRAKYVVAPSGDSKHGGDALVARLPAAEADPDKQLTDFLSEFEGEGVAAANKEHFSVGAMKVQLIEVAATYRFGVGPQMGPKRKRAAHVLKEHWRGLLAIVVTPDRGTWSFRLVGPNDTVAAAAAGFRAMVRSVN